MLNLVVGTANAAPGTRARGVIPVTNLPGGQHALPAPVSGSSLADPALHFQKPMQKGDLIVRILDVYGDALAELRAPTDGMIFGLRALPNVQTGDWCCFYAEIQGELANVG